MSKNDISIEEFIQMLGLRSPKSTNDGDFIYDDTHCLNWQSVFNYLNDYVANYLGIKKELNLVCSADYDYSAFNALPKSNTVLMRMYIFAPYWLCNQILLHQYFHNTDDDLRFSFNYYFGIMKDSCIFDYRKNSMELFGSLPIRTVFSVIDDINNIKASNCLTIASMIFAMLHEISHIYLGHCVGTFPEKDALMRELEADRLAYHVYLNMVEDNVNGRIRHELIADVLHEPEYLAPAVFLDFLIARQHVNKVLYNETTTINNFTDLVTRKKAIIDYILEWPGEIDTDIGNDWYQKYEDSINLFIRIFMGSDEKRRLEEFKNKNGWCRMTNKSITVDNLKVIKGYFRNIGKECDDIVDIIADCVEVEYGSELHFVTIIDSGDSPLKGKVVRASNIKIDLSDLLPKLIDVILVSAVTPDDKLTNLLILIDFIALLFQKSSKILDRDECTYIIKIYEYGKPIDEERFICDMENLGYSVSTSREVINLLKNYKIISIEEGNIVLVDKVTIKYDF